jgi:5-methylcytosine-specific restriction enzyme A
MARSRKSAWLRDELIVALDLYRTAGRKPSLEQLDDLSATLRSMPIERELADDPSFRGRDSVYLKLANFVALDPNAGITGMTRGGAEDKRVWEEFADDPYRLERVASAIRGNLTAASPRLGPDDEEDEAPEGRILTKAHRTRERNRRLVARKKAAALAASGRLICEICGFDFAAVYGNRGDGFIECHHTTPLAELRPHAKTRLSDLALVCANCHRMIHRRAPWLSLSELGAIISSTGDGARSFASTRRRRRRDL